MVCIYIYIYIHVDIQVHNILSENPNWGTRHFPAIDIFSDFGIEHIRVDFKVFLDQTLQGTG